MESKKLKRSEFEIFNKADVMMYNEDTPDSEELAADDINYDDFSLEPFSY